MIQIEMMLKVNKVPMAKRSIRSLSSMNIAQKAEIKFSFKKLNLNFEIVFSMYYQRLNQLLNCHSLVFQIFC